MSLENAKRYNIKGEEIREKAKLMNARYVHEQSDLTEEVSNYVKYNMLRVEGNIDINKACISAKMLRNVITEKATDWSYEKEWRLIPREVHVEE